MTTEQKATTPKPEGVTERQAGVPKWGVCWARFEDMRVCGRPAKYVNNRLRAWVCDEHINA